MPFDVKKIYSNIVLYTFVLQQKFVGNNIKDKRFTNNKDIVMGP